jgi:hypothetical protein
MTTMNYIGLDVHKSVIFGVVRYELELRWR